MKNPLTSVGVFLGEETDSLPSFLSQPVHRPPGFAQTCVGQENCTDMILQHLLADCCNTNQSFLVHCECTVIWPPRCFCGNSTDEGLHQEGHLLHKRCQITMLMIALVTPQIKMDSKQSMPPNYGL